MTSKLINQQRANSSLGRLYTEVKDLVEKRVSTGTFSRPMPIGDGKTIPPTGKSFKLTMTTIGHWNGDVMDHEWLFWDNHEFMKQIGIAN